MQRKSLAGFTIIELLIVIGLLSTLAAMLFPVFVQVRGKARQASCASNLRQIGVAVSLYANDYDDMYPYGVDAFSKYSINSARDPYYNPALRDLPLVHDVMGAYIADKRVWSCPADTGMRPWEWTFISTPNPKGIEPSLYEVYGNSYGYRSELALKQKLHGVGVFYHQHDLGTASLVVMSDTNDRWHGTSDDPEDQRCNSLFGDGHVKLQSKFESIKSGSLPLEPW